MIQILKMAVTSAIVASAIIYSTGPVHADEAAIHKSPYLTEAAAITVNGKPIVFLNNEKSAEDVIEKLKLQYMTKDQLNKLNSLPPLKLGWRIWEQN